MSKLATIQQCISEILPDKMYQVRILAGAPEVLVWQRHKRSAYETNRDIKYWSTYFLLKAMTSSGEIKRWRSQRPLILAFLQMNERTFYNHLKWLQDNQLLSVDRSFNIHLASYRKAASLLEIAYTGLITIEYNPIKHAGKQVFQYFLRAEEFRYQKGRQLNALIHNLDKNPLLRNDLMLLMIRSGANQDRLKTDVRYLQERLLMLQMQLFRQGSELLGYVMAFRADINRGIGAIQRNHCYKGKASVSYLKKRMDKLQVIQVKKIAVESLERARIYVPDSETEKGHRDGYKWIPRKRSTVWFLTDQISFNYSIANQKENEREKKKAA